MNILPAKYDEAQERLEELRERSTQAGSDLADAQEEERLASLKRMRRENAYEQAHAAYIAHLEKMVSEAAAEKAVRG